MCFVSFIVPVYNLKEEEVSTCISSIANQTVAKSNYEIIIVDDGSNCGIEVFCETIAKQFGATVLHQKNQGLAVARNAGMKASHGEWIVHVDGDDWVDSELVESLLNRPEKKDADIVVWGFCVANGKRRQKLLLKNKSAFNDDYSQIRENAICSILDSDSSFASLALNTSWGKAYRRDFISANNLYYDASLRRAQDAVYNLYAFSKASCVDYVDKALNYYRTDNVSLSRGFNPKNYDYLRLTALAVEKFAAEEDVSLRVKQASSVFVQRCFRMINEQYYQHKDNPLSFRERRRLFMEGIQAEPFKSAFARGVTRDGSLNRISDYLYKHQSFCGIYFFNCLIRFARRFKKYVKK